MKSYKFYYNPRNYILNLFKLYYILGLLKFAFRKIVLTVNSFNNKLSLFYSWGKKILNNSKYFNLIEIIGNSKTLRIFRKDHFSNHDKTKIFNFFNVVNFFNIFLKTKFY